MPETEPLQPTPEFHAGQNNPYRGTEQHGVAFDAPTYREPIDHDGVPTVYEPPEPEPEPIPVRVVSHSARERPAWDGTTYTINQVAKPVLIAGFLEKRNSLSINNLGPDKVYLHPNGNVNNSAFAAVELDVGGSFNLDNGAAVWAFIATGSASVRVTVVWEYKVEG